MHYTLRSLSGKEEMLDTLVGHVFVRAYEAAWRARHREEPVGPHVLPGLDLIIEFIQQTKSLPH
jgi:hypothetical protein